MPHIKWAGVVRGELASYQQGQLPANAVKLAMPATTSELMRKAAIFLLIPFVVIFAAMFGKTFLSRQVSVDLWGVLAGVLAGFPGLLLHELLHAIPYPRQAVVYIGFYPKSLAAMALVSYPLSRRKFIRMSLLPMLLGAIPMLLFLLLPAGLLKLNGFLFGFAAMGLTSPYPDYYTVFQVLRQTPSRCRLQFAGDDLYYL